MTSLARGKLGNESNTLSVYSIVNGWIICRCQHNRLVQVYLIRLECTHCEKEEN